MIRELVNYSEWLKKDFPDLFEGKLEKGLHIFVKLNNDKISGIQTYKIGERSPQITDENKFVFDFAKQVFKSNVISANKCLHNDKYILSNNPFCYKLNLVTDTELRNHFDFNDITKNGKIRKRKILNHINAIKKDFLIFYDEETRSIAKKIIRIFINTSFEMIRSINTDDNGSVIFNTENEFVKQTIEKIKETYLNEQDLETSESFLKKLNNKKLIIYFDVDKALYDKTSDIYKQKKGGLKQSIPTIDYQNITYTLNSFINNANENKIFLKHLTAFNKYNYYHKKEFDELLEDFKPAIKRLPNPLPIFIVRSELNDKFIKIFKNDKSKGYKEIISELFKTHKEDLNNYYLFNGNSVAINDFDYVSSFSYEIDRLGTNEYFKLFLLKKFEYKIENIFDLEKIISKQFLFKINRNNKTQFELLNTNYFSDKLDAGNGNEIPAFIENNTYKYRKLLYDAFYKSRLHLITANIFKDICMPVIRYEISHDETNSNGYSKNEFRIKEKLLIYIDLNKLFDKNNINFGGIDMPSELPRYYDNLLSLLRGEIDYYQSDEDFAFGTGQLIRYLLEKSESGNKNHSMLEPFLQKLGNFNVFIKQINRALKTYGYKIKMNYDLFDKMMSNSTSYKLEADNSLKDLETILISGYFAKLAIWQIIEEKEEQKRKQIEKNNKETKNE